MSFDASRFSFNPWNDFTAVVMQQGRVQLDSDWNEWLAILDRRIQVGTMDTVGRAVYPAATTPLVAAKPAARPLMIRRFSFTVASAGAVSTTT